MYDAHVICRYSAQDKEDASIERQKERCLEVAKSLGCDLAKVKIIANDNLSGGLPWEKRIDLLEVDKDIKAGECQKLIMHRSDRLSRNIEVSGKLLALFTSHNIELYDESGKVDYQTASGELFFVIKAGFASYERKIIKDRTYAGKKQRASSGRYVGGAIPLGYVLDAEKRLPDGSDNPNYRKLKPYPPHAEIVQEIYRRMRDDHISPFLLARAFNSEGMVIPDFEPEVSEIVKGRSPLKEQSRVGSGHRITARMIRDIAANPVYIGVWKWGKDVSKPDNHEPLVGEDTFWPVFKMVTSVPHRKGMAARTEPLPLSGLLHCVTHDHMVHAHSARGVYVCYGQYKKAIEDKSHFHFSAYVLEDAITEVVIRQCSYPEYASEILRRIEGQRDSWINKMADLQKNRKRLQQEVENLKNGLPSARTQQEASYFLDQIRSREQALVQIDKEAGRSKKDSLGAAEIGVVRRFMADILGYWDRLPDVLKNRFLLLILERVDIEYAKGSADIDVAIHWRTGRSQHVAIRLHTAWLEPDWNGEEERSLRALWLDGSVSQLMDALPGRTWPSIRGKAQKLGLRRRVRSTAKTIYAPWRPPEEALLVRLSEGKLTISEVVSLTGRTPRAISQKLSRMRPRELTDRRIAVTWEVEDSLPSTDWRQAGRIGDSSLGSADGHHPVF